MPGDSTGPDWVERWRREEVGRYGYAAPLVEQGYMKIARRYGYIAANHGLHDLARRVRRGDLWLSRSHDELREWCDAKALAMANLVTSRRMRPIDIQRRVTGILTRYGMEYPLGIGGDLFCPFEQANKKLACKRWWRRQVSRLQFRELEDYARRSRLVSNQKQIYCSDFTAEAIRQRDTKNSRMLAEVEAVNDAGDKYTLAELAGLSVSDPAIRRSELMVRIAGFEEYAKRLGYVAQFITVTCPSRFHATHIGGHPNENYNGETARQANDYLGGVWARARATLARRGVGVFGFRVAEPHHDGCPHWHYLLFCDVSDRDCLNNVLRGHAMADSPGEPGAAIHRYKVEEIDPAKGSAVGYIAKYISKNIDGYGVQRDLYKHDAINSAARITAWARVHGIRQFQQIGGPSVTVWRELRRLEELEPGPVESARAAADAGQWADYCALMGSGRDQLIKLAKWHEFDSDTGECLDNPVSRYGEPTPGKVFGVECHGQTFLTRFYRWTISRVDHVLSGFAGQEAGTLEGWRLPDLPGYVRDWLNNSPIPDWFAGFGGGAPPPLEFCQ